MKHVFTYLDLAYKELKRVVWPSLKEAAITVALVFFVVVLGGMVLFTLDEVASMTVSAIIRLNA